MHTPHITPPTPTFMQGDIYFTSSLRMPNCRLEPKSPLPPPHSLERRTSQPTRHPSNPESINVYKISADNLTGGGYRRASTASMCSAQTGSDSTRRTSVSDDVAGGEKSSLLDSTTVITTSSSEPCSRSCSCSSGGSPMVTRATHTQDGLGNTTSTTAAVSQGGCGHVLLPSNGEGSPNGTRKRFNKKTAILTRPIIMEAESEGALFQSSSSTSSENGGQQLLRDNLSREHSICSSPDSGVLTDDCSVTLSDWKTKSFTAPGSQMSPLPTAIRD